MKVIATLSLLLAASLCGAETMDIRTAFEALNTPPRTALTFANSLDINNRGGHVQGVQRLGNRFILSGSASDAAWFAIVDAASERVVDVRKILPKPLKHAGGFQINDGRLAVGVEDNRRRDRSRVLIYDVGASDGIPDEPATVIDRRGPRERATAGAVGVARFEGRLWVVVGNWDSRHLDFYVTEDEELALELAFTLEPDALTRESWIDAGWYSYQNLNLFEDNGALYLIGTTSLDETTEVADLFQLDLEDETPSLVKVGHHRLRHGGTSRLRWGGGIERGPNGQLRLYATEAHVESTNTLTVYGPEGQ